MVLRISPMAPAALRFRLDADAPIAPIEAIAPIEPIEPIEPIAPYE
jgi:hypothetical protein